MEFGELKSVDLRVAWPDGQDDFKLWLADNLERLSAAIDVPLEVDSDQFVYAPFVFTVSIPARNPTDGSIPARNPTDGSRVLIKTQLESAEYTHLGEILAYLAHIEAQTTIWVARDFRELHLSAIRWLNEHTTTRYAFFAVRVRVVQIADGPLAPLFEVLERPSAETDVIFEDDEFEYYLIEGAAAEQTDDEGKA